MAIQNPKRLISIDEYHRMAADGLFSEDDRVELIEGEIVEMTPIGDRHALGVLRLNLFFHRGFLNRGLISPQNPLRFGGWSEPQPDVAVLAWRDDLYAYAAPASQDVLLLVEVADSTIGYDRKIKMPLYAKHGIGESWILNLAEDVLEIYRQPSTTGYRKIQRLRRGDSIAMEAFPDVVFSVSDLLGPAS